MFACGLFIKSCSPRGAVVMAQLWVGKLMGDSGMPRTGMERRSTRKSRRESGPSGKGGMGMLPMDSQGRGARATERHALHSVPLKLAGSLFMHHQGTKTRKCLRPRVISPLCLGVLVSPDVRVAIRGADIFILSGGTKFMRDCGELLPKVRGYARDEEEFDRRD